VVAFGVYPSGNTYQTLMIWSVIRGIVRLLIGLRSGLLVSAWLLRLPLGLRFLLGRGLLLMLWRLDLCLRLQVSFWFSLGLLRLGHGLLLLTLGLLHLGRILLGISFLFDRSL
jgi:hypothetical protein